MGDCIWHRECDCPPEDTVESLRAQLGTVTRERDEARGRLKAITMARDNLLGASERARYGDYLLSEVRNAHARQVVRTKNAEAERDAALERERRLREALGQIAHYHDPLLEKASSREEAVMNRALKYFEVVAIARDALT